MPWARLDGWRWKSEGGLTKRGRFGTNPEAGLIPAETERGAAKDTDPHCRGSCHPVMTHKSRNSAENKRPFRNLAVSISAAHNTTERRPFVDSGFYSESVDAADTWLRRDLYDP